MSTPVRFFSTLKTRRVLLMVPAVAALVACHPAQEDAKPVDPFVQCAAFEFRVRDAEDLKQARLMMYDVAIDLAMKFQTENPVWRIRDEIGGQGYPARFTLRAEQGAWVDKHWVQVVHLAGGPPQSPKYTPPSTCLDDYNAKFSKLRERFAARWQVTEGASPDFPQHSSSPASGAPPASK